MQPPNMFKLSPRPLTLPPPQQMLTDAMTGNTTCPGEGGMSWCIDPSAFQNDDPSMPLKEEPTEFRRGR